ncbi:hypothetical protein BAS07_18520 [Elizabethkingia anophelis]|nr:hypothetical protein BBD30_11205 [Elizabethkingia anophelis]OPB54912.1 hypothetical protein BAS07_18520 [Elizabethkingia anophelis]
MLVHSVLILSSINEVLFFLKNKKNIRDWVGNCYYSLFIAIITILSYSYINPNYKTFLLGIIFLLKSLLLLGIASDLRNHFSTNWKKPSIPIGLAILFSISLSGYIELNSILIKIIIITTSLSYILLVLEFKKLNKHYKSIKILRRRLE